MSQLPPPSTKQVARIITIQLSETETVKFREYDIFHAGLNTIKTADDVAAVLAANVRRPILRADDTVEITASNFNDDYVTMISVLQVAV